MGTDIHWFVERYDQDEDEWALLDGTVPLMGKPESPMVYDGRNYDLFGKLGWAKNRTKDSVDLRGLPIDVSPITQACAEISGADGIDHSWISIEDLGPFADSDPRLREALDAAYRVAHGSALRIVYWFDR